MESPAFIAAAGTYANPFSENADRFFYILWKVDPVPNPLNPGFSGTILTEEA
jgi:hypothetical protein